MKISGTNGIESTSTRRTQRRGDQARGSFQLESDSSARPAAPVGGSSPLTAVDALLTLQSVPESLEGKRKAVRRADDMLDLLDDIRVGLLEGRIPQAKLQGLLRVVQTRREAVADPGLSAVLDEIEVRAQVELAKHAAALAKR